MKAYKHRDLFIVWKMVFLLGLLGMATMPSTSIASAARSFKTLNTENLSEWIVEGKLHYQSDQTKGAYFYTWTQIDTHFKLELREKSMVGRVVASAEGELWAEANDINISGQAKEVL